MALNHYLSGGRVTLVATFAVKDPLTGALTPTNPTTVSFKYDINKGADFGPFVFPAGDTANPAVGTFTYAFNVNTAGRYRCRVEGTGTCKAAAEDSFDVDASVL